MELLPEEKNVLGKQINKAISDKNLELEVRLGLDIKKFKYQKNKLSRKEFLRILSVLLKESQEGHLQYDATKPFEDTLDIWVWLGQRRNSIRHTITGMRSLMDYCKNNTLYYQNPTYMYKDSYYWSKEERVIMEQEGLLKDSKTSMAVNDSEYGIRFSLKEEIPLIFDPDTKELSIQVGTHMSDTTNRKVDREINNYRGISVDQAPKSFRYKRRYSLITLDNLVRFDVTVVKSSKKRNFKTIPSTSFYERQNITTIRRV